MNQLKEGNVKEDTLVLGIGNPLCGDDGAGIRVVEMLKQRELPLGVQVMEAGLPGWGLPTWLDGWQSVILVDAVEMGASPGTWRLFQLRSTQQYGEEEPEPVLIKQQSESISLHQPDLANGLALADALDLLPQTLYLYGIQPDNTEIGSPLSPAVYKSIPLLIEKILEDLGKGIYEPETNFNC